MIDPVMEALGSRFPRTCVTAQEAEKLAAALGCRLPTSYEYDKLFAIKPWPCSIHEWTSTSFHGTKDMRIVRGGSWGRDYLSGPRCSSKTCYHIDTKIDTIGFRLARRIHDDISIPKGWIKLINQ